ncbi:hypothetical protein [Spirulina sp. 06S082]|uniref:hypothetical protein n=1 Tax=Spirulina sp. 06S082 TaxID=3110248 RepID=UPI002B204A18|nr:hypothetical protein [Spirulina sp. 06S082]MEA5468387.1 hypothetical protein [Spirulina sp. 06S082]
MGRPSLCLILVLSLGLTGLLNANESFPAIATDTRKQAGRSENTAYQEVIRQTIAMVNDRRSQSLAQQFGLEILSLTWEDTGRYKNSAVGPNISDMTIQVQENRQIHLMPIIRYPNFSDKSADIPLDRFFLLAGNEKGRSPLQKVSLQEVLGNLRRYLHQPESWTGEGNSLLADRDTHVLVSAQACFLPIPKEGLATFNPVLFNYQSYEGDPAVLTLLATREGTSVTIIDNGEDSFDIIQDEEYMATWGQRLFFNQNGDRASLTGQRLRDFQGRNAPTGQSADAAGQNGLNMVMLIQVPLKQKNPNSFLGGGTRGGSSSLDSDVEAAVIGHGELEGPFTEIGNLAIVRDTDFPIRVTVQFYKATSNGIVSEQDMREIKAQIDRVYAEADYVGSLVVEGVTERPTEDDGNLK